MPTAKRSKNRGSGELTRQRIIQKSAPIFNRHGYTGTSISELMTATGLEKGGIYRHFKSKQELAAAAFDFAWESVSVPRQRGVEACVTALDKLRLFVRNFVDEVPRKVSGGCPLLNTAIDSDDGNPVLRSKARAALVQWRTSITTLVRNGQEAGEFRSGIDPDAVAVIVIASLEGALMISRLEESRESLRTAGKHLEQYLDSLQAIPI